MATPVPGGSEAAYLGFALVDALVDLLVEKGVIARQDVTAMLTALAKRCGESGQHFGKRSAEFITGTMLS
jgi:hypothetical protein